MLPELLQRHTKKQFVDVDAINSLQGEWMVFLGVLIDRPLAAKPNQGDSFKLNRFAGRSVKPPFL